MADLKESIIAVTWGSPQIVEGFVAALVTPGRGVETPGVSARVGGVPINKVDVGRAIKVGVGGTCVAGAAHAVNMTASSVKPGRKAKCDLMFIFITSFDNYIPSINHP